jgi:TrmH family RNA methyltransferase
MQAMLRLPPCDRTTFVLVSPHYPENVGAAARAMKTMGITDLILVNPGRLANSEHEMAFKMAVKSWDVLQGSRTLDSLEQALAGVDLAFTTSGRAGQSGVLVPRQAAELARTCAQQGQSIAVVFGNEKTGLSSADLAQGHQSIRIPMAAPQPSITRAQACQLIAYEWFCSGLQARERERADVGG